MPLVMGVNMQNVNTTIHYRAHKTVENYFQESGRGERSGVHAVSTVYWKHCCDVCSKTVIIASGGKSRHETPTNNDMEENV